MPNRYAGVAGWYRVPSRGSLSRTGIIGTCKPGVPLSTERKPWFVQPSLSDAPSFEDTAREGQTGRTVRGSRRSREDEGDTHGGCQQWGEALPSTQTMLRHSCVSPVADDGCLVERP